MRISRRADAPERADRLSEAVVAASHGLNVEGRVCGAHCTIACRNCGSTRCQCSCAPHCPQASRMLSSDPDLYPIEPAVTPLVYELKRTGVMQPCYSCEGHVNPDGALYKAPTVWFYCAEPAYLRLLAGGLGKMQSAGVLSAPWRISVTFSDADNPEATFALSPELTGGARSLQALQRDAGQIAYALGRIMVEEGRELRQRMGAG